MEMTRNFYRALSQGSASIDFQQSESHRIYFGFDPPGKPNITFHAILKGDFRTVALCDNSTRPFTQRIVFYLKIGSGNHPDSLISRRQCTAHQSWEQGGSFDQ